MPFQKAQLSAAWRNRLLTTTVPITNTTVSRRKILKKCEAGIWNKLTILLRVINYPEHGGEQQFKYNL